MSLNEGHEIVLLDSLTGGADGVIERQEARGQTALVNSDLLPTDRHRDDAEWQALGFVFGEVVPDDPMFQHATLPEGWSRKGSSHAMWTYIYDAEGFQRVSIFYKAAFYDRSAHMSIVRVPVTDAQQDAVNAIYETLGRYEKGEPWWGDMRQESRDDRAVITTWTLRQIHVYPEPETVHAIRTVVVMPDGSIASDTTEDVKVEA